MLSIASTASQDDRRAGRSRWVTLIAAGALALGFTFAAEPASADGAFKHAFKDEFGRIVAHQVASVAPLVFFGAIAPPVQYSYQVHHYRGYGYYDGPRYGHHARHYRPYKRHGHYAPNRSHQRKGHHCKHRH
jgi:hypothetical protein